MDVSLLLLVLVVLACPAGMGIMMWMMNKNMGGQHGNAMTSDQTPVNEGDRLVALRQQLQTLEAEIAEANQLVEREEARRKPLPNGQAAVPNNRRE
jgi:flagellar basal body-associated protein FliL